MPDQKPSVGRIVLYCYADRPPRPAIITAVIADSERGEVNLVVIFDGHNDTYDRDRSPIEWIGTRAYDPDGAQGTWHWPPRV